MGKARTLAQVYRHFGEFDAAETSPLYDKGHVQDEPGYGRDDHENERIMRAAKRETPGHEDH